MLELILVAAAEIIFLVALHKHLKTCVGAIKRERLKERLRGCL